MGGWNSGRGVERLAIRGPAGERGLAHCQIAALVINPAFWALVVAARAATATNATGGNPGIAGERPCTTLRHRGLAACRGTGCSRTRRAAERIAGGGP
jgi:hypothetical protein